VALLKAVAYGWQQVSLAENAAEIRGLAVQLYERLTTFGAHLNDVGKALGDSVKAFNRGVGSLERMVLPSARRFTDLGVQPRQRLAALKDVEETPRDCAPEEAAGESAAEHEATTDSALGVAAATALDVAAPPTLEVVAPPTLEPHIPPADRSH
jgi:DNA anti-recombination protein RmuC